MSDRATAGRKITTNERVQGPREIGLLIQSGVNPAASCAADEFLLAAVTRPPRDHLGFCRVYDFAGDCLSIGRYHLAPESTGAAISLHRRHSGGAAMPFGRGYVGFSLILPHRSALVSDDPMALAAEQVLNRCVRGLLEGCKMLGVPAFYPGLDSITVKRRMLAMVSFECAANGALLFDAIIANGRDFSELPRLLDATDPGGLIAGRLLSEEDATCLRRELGVELNLAEVAEMLCRGYERRFGLRFERFELPENDLRRVHCLAAESFAAKHWLLSRRSQPDLDHHAVSRTLLGRLDVYFGLTTDHRLRRVLLGGDLIANSASIEKLERALEGCALQRATIEAVVAAVYSRPENYLLGIGPLARIAEKICRRVEWPPHER